LQSLQPIARAKKLKAFFLVLPTAFNPASRRLAELDPLVEKLAPYPLAVELRHNDWVKGKQRGLTLDHFRERGIVWIAVDMPQIENSVIMPAVDEVTNPKLAYLRLHGRNPNFLKAKTAEEGHTYAYEEKELKEIVTRAKHLAGKAEDVCVIANNHARDFAPKTAITLRRLLGQPVPESVGQQEELF
jgi:uncharacterized protein YecE (DUF72 family)